MSAAVLSFDAATAFMMARLYFFDEPCLLVAWLHCYMSSPSMHQRVLIFHLVREIWNYASKDSCGPRTQLNNHQIISAFLHCDQVVLK